MTSTTLAKNAESSKCQVYCPQVLPCAPAHLARLSRGDQDVLLRLLSEPLEYVDHPLFAKRNVETLLFGSKASRGVEATCFQEDPKAEVAPGARDHTLSTANEILLFQRLNYARLRIATVLRRYQGRQLSYRAVCETVAWQTRAVEARERLVQANVPLVLAMAKRTRLCGLDYNEMVSEGNFALLRSVDKFDCSRGYKFSTYGCRAILKSFSRVAMRTSRYRGRFPAEFDPEMEKSDFVDRKRDGVEIECVDEIRDILAQNRALLSSIEQTVIRERFALDMMTEPAKGKTLEQVGAIIGVTKERVRQIQNKALAKIRVVLEDTYLAA